MTTNTNACGCTSAAAGAENTVTKEAQACCTTKGEARRRAVYTPAVDVHETQDAFVVTADVPGAESSDIDLTVDDGVLTLRAEVTDRSRSSSYIHREYGVGAYERTFRVGEGVDAAAISAELNHGVLTVRLPKAESAKPRKIEVNTK